MDKVPKIKDRHCTQGHSNYVDHVSLTKTDVPTKKYSMADLPDIYLTPLSRTHSQLEQTQDNEDKQKHQDTYNSAYFDSTYKIKSHENIPYAYSSSSRSRSSKDNYGFSGNSNQKIGGYASETSTSEEIYISRSSSGSFYRIQ